MGQSLTLDQTNTYRGISRNMFRNTTSIIRTDTQTTNTFFKMANDIYTRNWIISNSISICSNYDDGVLTLRSLHYQLVGRGMTNDIQHYKRVVAAMIEARWNNQIGFDQFSDLDREMVGETQHEETNVDDKIEKGKEQIEAWMTSYHKNRWENQPIYPEILIEKKALQGVFAPVCNSWNISLGACKGYPSLTFQHDMYKRYKDISTEKQVVLLYFGDYDPSGEDIPRSIVDTLSRFGVDVDLRRIALMEEQVVKWQLPHAPAKVSDSRTANWDGFGQVELDAVRPEKLQELLTTAISDIFDQELYDELLKQEDSERRYYQSSLRSFVNNLKE